MSVTPDDGYVLDKLSVTAEDASTPVDVAINDDGSYSFKMPDSDATVTATFRRIEPSYVITIPSGVNLNNESGMTVTVSDVENLPAGSSIVVSVSSQNGGKLVLNGNEIGYTFTEELKFTEAGNMNLAMQVDQADVAGKPAGEYTDVLNFTHSVSAD